tara:strand:+ start:495 stop:962 length:468 start_codon:yes stop_codon:yes gene_type:complete
MIKYVIALLVSFSHILLANEMNVIDSLSKNKRLTKLNEYIVSSELSKDFLQFESLTVFAPLDDAFAALSAKTYYGYLKEENKNKLQSLVNYHFVEGNFFSENITDTLNVNSVDGRDIEIKKVNGIIYINGAEVVESDISHKTGYIHLINKVLIPK